MSRARDNANLGAQAGSGLDASDITSGALGASVTGGAGLGVSTAATSTFAPKAGPTFTGTVAIPNVANLETAVVANTAKVTNATHSGDVTGATALTIADDAVTGAKIENNPTIAGNLTVSGDIVPSTPLSHRNMIINGDFQVSQRGDYTSATALTSSPVYYLDRFKTKINTISGTLTHKLNQIVNGKTTNTMLLTATSAATGRVETVQQIEATAPFVSQTITFSAWVKSDNSSARLIVHQNGANVQTSSNAHTGGGAFELLKGTVTCASNSGAIFLYSGIQAAGTGNVSVANNDYFEMAFVQLELGSSATPFEHRSYGDELARCQRYCRTLYMVVGIYEGTQLRTSTIYNPMRVNPTVLNFHPSVTTLYHENHAIQGYNITDHALVGNYGRNGCLDVRITGTSTGTPAWDTPMIAFNATVGQPLLTLSAEL